MSKRILSLLLALVMLLSVVPFQALAEETTETGAPAATEAVVIPETTEAPVVPETTAEVIVPETTEAAVVPETTEATAVPETTEAAAVPETTEATEAQAVVAQSVTVSQAEGLNAVPVGGQVQLSAVVLPEDTQDKTLVWTSSDEAIASVDENGLVTGIAQGTVTITAACGEATGTYELTVAALVTVEAAQAAQVYTGSIITTPSDDEPEENREVLAGTSITLKAVDTDDLNKVFYWEFVNEEDELVAKLSKGGILTPKVGSFREKTEVEVQAYNKDNKDERSDIVTLILVPRVSQVKLTVNDEDKTNGEILVNIEDSTGVKIDASVIPKDAAQKVDWESTKDDAMYTRVDDDTSITLTPTGNKLGTINVTAKATDGSGVKASAKVRFVKLPESITIENLPEKDADGNYFLMGGNSVTLSTDIARNKSLSFRTVTWEVYDADAEEKEDGSYPASQFASIGVETGKLTTKKVTEKTTITVRARLAGDSLSADQMIYSDSVNIVLYTAVTSVEITANPVIEKNTIQLPVDGDFVLTAEVKSEAALQEVVWASSDEKIAVVTPNGLTADLTVKAPGSVRITATAKDGSGKRATLNLKIEAPAKTLTIDPQVEGYVEGDDLELISGNFLNLKATVWTVEPADEEDDGVKAGNQKVTWSVTDENGDPTKLASISSNGRLSARSVRLNTPLIVKAVSAEDKEVEATCTVILKPAVKRNLMIQLDDPIMGEPRYVEDTELLNNKDSYDFTAGWYDSDTDDFIPSGDAKFFSSKPNVAAFTEDGHLEAKASGTATITVTCEDSETGRIHTEKFNVKVTNMVGYVEITQPSKYELRSGESLTLRATAWTNVAKLTKANNQKMTWKAYEYDEEAKELVESTHVSVNNGRVTAKTVTENVGPIFVYATSTENEAYSDQLELLVRPKQAYQMKVFYDDNEVQNGLVNVNLQDADFDLFTVKAYISDPNSLDDGQETLIADGLTWTSSNKKVLEIDKEGNATFKGIGKTTLTAKLVKKVNNRSTTYTAKITVNVINFVDSIEIAQVVPNQGLFIGKSMGLKAKVDGTADYPATNKQVKWSLENPDQAEFVTLNARTGYLTAKKYTDQEITVVAEALDGSGVSDTFTLKMYKKVTDITIQDGADKLNGTVKEVKVNDGTFTVTAEVEGDEYGDMTIVKWTSSNSSVAKVDAKTGEITILRTGTTTIKATSCDGYSKSVKFTLRVTKN